MQGLIDVQFQFQPLYFDPNNTYTNYSSLFQTPQSEQFEGMKVRLNYLKMTPFKIQRYHMVLNEYPLRVCYINGVLRYYSLAQD